MSTDQFQNQITGASKIGRKLGVSEATIRLYFNDIDPQTGRQTTAFGRALFRSVGLPKSPISILERNLGLWQQEQIELGDTPASAAQAKVGKARAS